MQGLGRVTVWGEENRCFGPSTSRLRFFPGDLGVRFYNAEASGVHTSTEFKGIDLNQGKDSSLSRHDFSFGNVGKSFGDPGDKFCEDESSGLHATGSPIFFDSRAFIKGANRRFLLLQGDIEIRNGDLDSQSYCRYNSSAILGFSMGSIRIESKIFRFDIIGYSLLRIIETKRGIFYAIDFDLDEAIWLRDSLYTFRTGSWTITKFGDAKYFNVSYDQNYFGGFLRVVANNSMSDFSNFMCIPVGRRLYDLSSIATGLESAISELKQMSCSNLPLGLTNKEIDIGENITPLATPVFEEDMFVFRPDNLVAEEVHSISSSLFLSDLMNLSPMAQPCEDKLSPSLTAIVNHTIDRTLTTLVIDMDTRANPNAIVTIWDIYDLIGKIVDLKNDLAHAAKSTTPSPSNTQA